MGRPEVPMSYEDYVPGVKAVIPATPHGLDDLSDAELFGYGYRPQPKEIVSTKGMSRAQLLALHKELCGKAAALMELKNTDYTAGGGVFENFSNAEIFDVSREQGLLIRVMDKLMRMKSFIRNGTLALKNEAVEDSILDVINYMVLLAGMIEEKKDDAPDV